MRPLKITIQGFGPYKSETEIDFSKFNDYNLFLIYGKTGGGKTTILDAITCALYGKGSGSLRNHWLNLRNVNIDEESPTFVDFIFSLGSVEYRFYRYYSYRLKKRGSGKIEESESCCYKRNLGEEWELIMSCSDSALSSYAETLLGFNHSQFSQVIILPQGEFRKLLTSSSSEKQEILEKLFQADQWKSIMKNAVSYKKQLSAKIDDLTKEHNVLLASVNAETLLDLKEQTLKAEMKFNDLSRQSQRLLEESKYLSASYSEAKRTLEDFTLLETTNKRISDLDANKEYINNLKKDLEFNKKIQAVLPYYEAYIETQKDYQLKLTELNDLESKLIKSQKTLETLDKQSLEIPKLKSSLEKINSDIPKIKDSLDRLNRIQALKQQLVKIISAIDSANVQKKNLESKISEFEGRIKKGNELYDDRQINYIDKLPIKKEKLITLENISKQYEAFYELKKDVNSLKTDYDALNSEFILIKKDYESSKNRLTKYEMILKNNSAFSLSLELRDNSPCPVCGSLSHPSPAKADSNHGNDLNPDEINSLREQISLLESSQAKALTNLSDKKSKLDLYLKELEKSQAAIAEYNTDFETVKINIKQLKDEIDQSEKFKKEQKDVKIKIANLTSNMENAKKNIADLELNKAELDKQSVDITSRTDELKSGIVSQYYDMEISELNSMLENYLKDSDKLTKTIEVFNESHEKAQKECVEIKQKAESLSRYSKEIEQKSILSKNKFDNEVALKGLRSSDFESYDKNNAIDLSSIENEITQYNNELASLQITVKNLDERLENKPKPDIGAIQSKIDKNKEKNSEVDNEIGRVKQKIESYSAINKKLEKNLKDTELRQAEYKICARVSDLINGQNQYNTPLNQFVIGIMMDSVLECANVYLQKFSSGQYFLLRKYQSGGRGSRGLELYVTDANIGGERSVSTLSGGEIFLASLSLALGLSDSVQSFSGGIRLESIFVDEGFGSLDSETLDCAIRALNEIQSSGRLVGIISHVSELKARIPSRIEVNVHPNHGSQIEIISL